MAGASRPSGKIGLAAPFAAVLGLVASLAIAAGNFAHPYAVSEGAYSDHFSHMGSTILFAARGLDIYRRPVRDNLKRSFQPKDLAFARRNRLGTQELFVNPLDSRRPPLAINWSFQIRPYPPGVYVLFAPVAALFQYQRISFSEANRVIIFFLILAACGSTYLLFGDAFAATDRWGRGLRVVSALLACYWIQCWALRGFYDVVSILFVFLCLWALEGKRWLDCVVLYCFAVFIHYRALYYAPVPLIAVFMAWRESRAGGANLLREWAGKPRFWLALAMATASGACFWIALPQLESFAGNNPLFHFYDAWAGLSVAAAGALALACLALATAAAGRDWTIFLILGCYLVFLVRTPQTYPWHSLFLAPALVLCARRSSRWIGRLEWASVLALVFWLGHFVYRAV